MAMAMGRAALIPRDPEQRFRVLRHFVRLQRAAVAHVEAGERGDGATSAKAANPRGRR